MSSIPRSGLPLFAKNTARNTIPDPFPIPLSDSSPEIRIQTPFRFPKSNRVLFSGVLFSGENRIWLKEREL